MVMVLSSIFVLQLLRTTLSLIYTTTRTYSCVGDNCISSDCHGDYGRECNSSSESGMVIVVFTDIGDIIAYKHGLHFCEEVYSYRNQDKV